MAAPATGEHSRDVVDLAIAVAEALHLDAAARRHVEFTALLYDVGKIRVPKSIINKPGKLTGAEWAIIRRLTIEGEMMLRKVGGALATVGQFVRSSLERYDGSGGVPGASSTLASSKQSSTRPSLAPPSARASRGQRQRSPNPE